MKRCALPIVLLAMARGLAFAQQDTIQVKAHVDSPGLLESVLVTWLPMVVLIGVFALFMRRLGNVGERVRREEEFRGRVDSHLQGIAASLERIAATAELKKDSKTPPPG